MTSQRDPYFDNLRAVLMILVVMGHAVESMGKGPAHSFYVAVYAFHMPAFVLVSGYLSRSWEATGRRLGEIVGGLIVPYLIFRVILAAESWLLAGNAFTLAWLTPIAGLWFLVALAAWRLAAPLLRVLRGAIAIAVLVSLLAPADPNIGLGLTLGRTLGFLPFFVIGLRMTPVAWEYLRRCWLRWAGLAVLVAIAVISWLDGHRIKSGWLFLRDPYKSWPSGLVIRLAVLAVGLLGAAAIAAVVTRRHCFLTTLGRNSLTIYLLHLAILGALRYLPATSSFIRSSHSGPILALTLAGAVALAVALGTNQVARATRWLTRPPLDRWLVKQD